MTLKEHYSNSEKPVISFEIFPPKGENENEAKEKFQKLLEHLKILKKYNPAFVSLTYGAGGSGQSNSFDMIRKIQSEVGLDVMPHFTCVCVRKNHISDYLNEIESLGIKNILALRGDIPCGCTIKDFDFHYANELVEFIKANSSLSIGVAGYPEGHFECDDFIFDMKNLKRKIETGADAVFTQMFFENEKFYSFYQKAKEMGIETPIIPGILPIRSYGQLEKMLSMARVTLPQNLSQKLEKFKDNPEDIKKLGVEFATQQCEELLKFGVCGLHFYTLNSSKASSEILNNLGLN